MRYALVKKKLDVPARARKAEWVSYLAEGIGSFALVFVGCGAIMVDALSGGKITHVGVSLVFGLIISVMIYTLGHLSGAHFNPAVTLGFVLARHFPLSRLPWYWLAQCTGAVLAAASLRLLLGNVAQLGTTLPKLGAFSWQALIIETILSFLLMLVIMAMATDTRAVGQAAALAIGGTIALEALFAGPLTGASMNPARSLGPALLSWTWTDQWVYFSAPLLGATLGAIVYRLLRDTSQPESLPSMSGADQPDLTPAIMTEMNREQVNAAPSGEWKEQS